MSAEAPYHTDRARAESFGAAAAAYDRYRPGYPDALIDRLARLRPKRVLDVGCGTGKAARQLIARGLDVLGVEIDAQMAALARGHGVDVEVSSFEQWDARGRTFDLIVSGQAWHWVDPVVGAPKLLELLRPGGTVCLFWNFEKLDGSTKPIVDAVYARIAPELIDAPRTGTDNTQADSLRNTGRFGSVRSEQLAWQELLTVDDWIGRISTYSRELLLGRQRLAWLQDGLREAFTETCGTVRLDSGTYVVWARP